MTVLKKSECNLLHLVLKRKWFDLIDSGEKKEEYRGKTPHWERIYTWWNKDPSKPYVVAFQRGYNKPSMWFVVDGITLSDQSMKPEWGEPKGPHHILFLGERVHVCDG